ncbi:uncharacterized protein [Atheta coriaria]|uniref:uncharacterized protein n=1 Tax=Dalotia coriaria TaxID=877792 RepID=UPI0031F44BBB
MDSSELEDLILCDYCKQSFNDQEQTPKLLSCKHHFCLKCIRSSLSKGQEIYCVHCWKRTEVGDLGAETLPTYTAILYLSKNFTQMKHNHAMKLNDNTKSVQSATGQTTTAGKLLSENCHTHAMPLALWCQTCCVPLCRACATASDHTSHQIKSQNDTKEQLMVELQNELQSMSKLLNETQRLAAQQREFLLKILEACITLKTHVEADLTNNATHVELNDTRDLLGKFRMNLSLTDSLVDVQSLCASLGAEKQRLQVRYQEMYMQCQLDDLIRNSTVVFDFQLLKQALANIQNGELPYTGGRCVAGQQNPILFLANYCMSQLYSRHVVSKQLNGNVEYHQPPPNQSATSYLSPMPQQHHVVLPPGGKSYDALVSSHHSPVPLQRAPANVCPLFYFNIEVNGAPMGRVVIEVRADVAPKMAKNFSMLATGEQGMGYKGCSIFQCWEGESVITGDFELNNGRGGRSVFEESFFLPDDTKLLAVRGTVGMRRTQKRHDNLGMVGSQFRVILQEMRGFTGIFGHVVEGIELVEKISTYGDTAGKPTKSILIAKCGKL